MNTIEKQIAELNAIANNPSIEPAARAYVQMQITNLERLEYKSD